MVHGGGHHHEESPSLTDTGGGNNHNSHDNSHHQYQNIQYQNSSYNPPVIVIREPYSTYGGQRSSEITYRRQRRSSENKDCKHCCLNTCCPGCCLDGTTETTAIHQSPKLCLPSMGLYLFISIVLAFVLIATSSVNEIWTLNAGETRQIHVTKLNKELQITSNIAKGTSLYVLDGACPALTGPTITLNATHELYLDQGDYQYDYFYLNQGSFLDVTIVQYSGASNMLLLKGPMSGDTADKTLDQDAILKQYAAKGNTARLQYMVPHSDTYMVVYDNASNSKGRATITYHVDLTSFDLVSLLPFSCQTANTCTVDLENTHVCILIQANKLITIHITSSRKWGIIAFWVALPLAIGICCFRPKEQYWEGNPSATNPAVIPTAPPYQTVPSEEPAYVVPSADILPVATLVTDDTQNKN